MAQNTRLVSEILRNFPAHATSPWNLSVVVENNICYGGTRMILFERAAGMKPWGRNLIIGVCALALAACAPMQEVDDTTGSRLAQPAPGTPPQPTIEAGDIAIVGQEVAHSIMDLPVVADATSPPLVRFTGVTSIVDQPIDTEPYTQLLRDRLLLLTREKLRFVEHTLPPYIPPHKGRKKAEPQESGQNTTDPDYEILAELRGHADSDFYRIQVEFVDIHSGEILFNGLYHIRREASLEPAPAPAPEPSVEAEPSASPPPPPEHDLAAPTTTEPATSPGNESL
jgi:hypothetical protein